MWLYPGLLTVVHIVRMKWLEIQSWNMTPLTAHSGHVLVPGWRCGLGPVMWDVLLCLLLQWAILMGVPTICLTRTEPTSFSGAWLVARHPWGLLRSQPLPQLPAGKCHKAEQGHLHFCHSFLIFLFFPLCCNFFNCWTCCWTLEYHNSVFFKCKNSQRCLFGDSVFNNAIFLHKSAFPHMCFCRGCSKSSLRVHVFICSEFKKTPLSFSLFFSFHNLFPLGLGFVPLSVYTQEVLGIQMHSEGLDYCFPCSSVVVVPHENSCGAGW